MLRTVLVLMAALLAVAHSEPASAAGPLVFEDRNNNDVFDGGDVDLTPLFVALEPAVVTTPHSVVVAAPVRKGCAECSIIIQAGRKITIKANVTVTGNGGTLDLDADEIRVASKVQINALAGVYMNASSVLIGDAVKLQAQGSSPTRGIGEVNVLAESVQIGSLFTVSTYAGVFIRASVGGIVLGPQANVVASNGDVGVMALGDIDIKQAKALRGSMVYVWSDQGDVDILLSRVGSRYGILIGGNTVTVTPSFLTKPYTIYDDAHPNGVTVSK